MDEAITEDVRKLLLGDKLEYHHPEVGEDSFRPQTKINMCHIVAGVLINDKNEVLLVQEAKQSCRGLWYLPAGRLEKGETLVDGAIREVEEESGLVFTPETMVCVECGGGTWLRYTFTGQITGGKLKTQAEADSESLQARWIPWKEINSHRINLRCHDVISLISKTLAYKNNENPHDHILPCIVPHKKNTHRCVIVQNSGEESLNVLVHKKDKPHFPSSFVMPWDHSLIASVSNVFKDAFGSSEPDLNWCGVLTVEHCGIPDHENDGVCITSLISLSNKNVPKIRNASYQWIAITNEGISKKLQERIENCLILDNHR